LELIKKGAKVCVYDPAVMKNAKTILKSSVFYAKNEYEDAKNVGIIIILIWCKHFKHIGWNKIGKVVHRKVVFDIRHIADSRSLSKKGFRYFRIRVAI
jgi:UDPglucose 6-dehydrogenase